ncbi:MULTISPECIES: helicase [Campylobacter]|uniref:helicase n=1 Tax=Campylobacter TaxID=194 RepID=UPI0018A9E971|nr:helicase [Campylobacter concisus]
MKKDIKISGQLLDINTHRKVAKVGMGVTLATVCLTALCMNGRGMKKLHTVSGIAFTCFAIYHAGLYDNGIFKKMILKAKTASKKE